MCTLSSGANLTHAAHGSKRGGWVWGLGNWREEVLGVDEMCVHPNWMMIIIDLKDPKFNSFVSEVYFW